MLSFITSLFNIFPSENNENFVLPINNKKIGYINCDDIVDGLSKMQLIKQNEHNDVFAEVEKVSYQLNKII